MINSLKDHFFWKYAFGKHGIFTGNLDVAYLNLQTVMRYAYLFFVIIVFIELPNVTTYQNLEMVSPIWSMVLFQGISPSILALVFQLSSLGILFLIFYMPKSHLLRILFFIFFFLLNSLSNSFGSKISHGLHLSIMLAFFLALIPSEKVSDYKLKSLLMFATAQFFLLMAYSLTGFWKLFWGVIEFFTQDVSLFSPLTLRNTLIYQFEMASPTFIGGWVLEHQLLGYVFYLLAVGIELFAIVIFFKANMHKFWGLLLISMHIGIELIIGVSSFAIIMTIGLMLVFSPFAKQTNIKETLLALPVISQLHWLSNKQRH